MISVRMALAALAAAWMAIATPAAAQVTSYEPQTLVAALQEAGYRARLSTDDEGNPEIETAADGVRININFYGCEQKKSCSLVHFITSWDCSKEMKTCEAANKKWAEEGAFTKSYVREDLLLLWQYLIFDEQGISENLFIGNFEVFTGEMAQLMAMF